MRFLTRTFSVTALGAGERLISLTKRAVTHIGAAVTMIRPRGVHGMPLHASRVVGLPWGNRLAVAPVMRTR